MMVCSGVLTFVAVPVQPDTASSSSSFRTRKDIVIYCSSTINATITDSPSTSTTSTPSRLVENNQEFSYSKANPSVRWPNLKLTWNYISRKLPHEDDTISPENLIGCQVNGETQVENGFKNGVSDENIEGLMRPSRTRRRKMNKLSLLRDKNWRKRVQFLTDRILGLEPEEFVADVLDNRGVQMTPTDFCFVVKWVGQASWQRALEVYEWLNLRHWYAPNARMLATMLAILGKVNQENIAVEIFTRTEPSVADTVQVYNAMMGVYARIGKFEKVKELLDLMRTRGYEPDLVSFNTLINARLKSGPTVPNLAIDLLNDVRKAGLKPDTITYNTLISGCSRESDLVEAVKVYNDMEKHKCDPDLWTYNAMISIHGKCGQPSEAERLFEELVAKGFTPDAVSYNSLLYAFAREGNVARVQEICKEMVETGFEKDEMTYNTMIHMWGKCGKHDLALHLYEDMKMAGRNPDAVTYTVLIDTLGKASKIEDAKNVMSEMLNAGIKPTLRTYSALISGYAKAGMKIEAEDTFNCMLMSGIRPDCLAYSVLLDVFLKSSETKKAMRFYKEMVHAGFVPDQALYESFVRVLRRDNRLDDIEKMAKDMEEVCHINPQVICSILVNGECYDHASKMLRLSISQGHELERGNLLSILNSYSSSGRHSEAKDLLDFLRIHVSGIGSHQLVTEALIVVLCKAHHLNAALVEYSKNRELMLFNGNLTIFESLIKCCEENDCFAEASHIFSDMRLARSEPSGNIYRSMVLIYCKLGFPETAHILVDQAEAKGTFFDDISVYISVIEAYGRKKLWRKAESVAGRLRQRCTIVHLRIWNALIHAYAASGCYEQARAIFNTLMRDGPSPSVDSINGLLQALITDGRLSELYVVIQELKDMNFKISKSSIMLMFEAFAQAGNISEVKKIYQGMKAAGYLPTMHLYRMMIKLLSKGKRVKDVKAMLVEMDEAGFKPDLSVWNSMLKMYTEIGDYKKASEIYQQIQKDGLKPDEVTYNSLILLYCGDSKPEESLSLIHEMRKIGLYPNLDTYKSLISAFARQKLFELAEELFDGLQSKEYKIDISFYHIMMKMFRKSGDHSKAEKLLTKMKQAGVEPTIATMHLLMASYGRSGLPEEAEKVVNNLKSTGSTLTTLPYSSLIDYYLKNGDYNTGIKKLGEMKEDGLEPDLIVWTCFIRAASLSDQASEAITLLNALREAGFDLPIRLLEDRSESLVSEMGFCFDKLKPLEDNAAFNFVNALVNLLWAFELRATASWIFQLAIKHHIYRHDVFRVSEKDWGADFRKLSAGSALVALSLWLERMQDASLRGSPQSPKSVVLITGTSEYDMISLNSTLKAYLWELGSPFLPCRTRSGLLIAKANYLRMWLKDSPFCSDLELKDAPSLPSLNSMKLVDGCFVRRGMVPAFENISKSLGRSDAKEVCETGGLIQS